MSEFQRTLKIALEIEKKLECTHPLKKVTLLEFQDSIEKSLRPVSKKYISRMTEKDPVTGEPRLGPTMTEKVTKLSALVEKISELTEKKLEEASDDESISIDESSQYTPVEFQMDATVVPRTLNSLFAFDKEESLRRREVPIMSATAGAEGYLATIGQMANTVREKKNEQLTKDRERISLIHGALISQRSGQGYLLEVLRKFDHNHSPMECTELKSFMRKLIGNIKNHPDDEKLRTLCGNNPVLYEKVTKYPEGPNLLVAVGFKATLDKSRESELTFTGDELKYADIMSLFTFKMEEPSPDVDMQLWIEWFDQLSEFVNAFS